MPHDSGTPFFTAIRRWNAKLHQPVCCRRVGITLEAGSEYEAHNVCLILVDHHLPVCAPVVTNEVGVGDAVLSVRHPFLYPPPYVLGNGP